MRIRPRHAGDADAIAAIYAPYVTDTVISFEERAADRGRDGDADRAADEAPIPGSWPRTAARSSATRTPARTASAPPTGGRPTSTVYVSPATPAPRRRASAVRGAVRRCSSRRATASRCAGIDAAQRRERRTARGVRLRARRGLPERSASSSARGGTSAGGSCELAGRQRGPRPNPDRRPAAGQRQRDLVLVEQQRQRRARVDRAPSEPEQVGRHLGLVEDRIAPVVEADQLGQQLGAQAVRLARDRVDAQPRRSCRNPRPAALPSSASRPPGPHGAVAQRQPGRPRVATPSAVRARSRRSNTAQRALDEPGGAVGVVAGAAPADLGRPAEHALALARRARRRRRARRPSRRSPAARTRTGRTGRRTARPGRRSPAALSCRPHELSPSAISTPEPSEQPDRAQVLAREPQRAPRPKPRPRCRNSRRRAAPGAARSGRRPRPADRSSRSRTRARRRRAPRPRR